MSVQTKTKPNLLDSTGRPLTLGAQLGSGGEGAVFDVQGRPELVAKLYHNPLERDKAAKIVAMTSIKTERLVKLTAWPIEALRDQSQAVIGFMMPKLSGHQVAFNLYSPKLRLQRFQNATWQFLIRSATNTALAFNAVHEHGHVIGDVNHGNLFVSDHATVRLIDCDSYQIAINGSRWLCEVGVPTHQPPEMQNVKSYKNLIRTPNHDNFGLAVLIFQFLFMARHPFSGRFLGSGEMPMERAISEYRFAYSANPVQMQPPPATLDLNGVTPQVAQLFERAFSRHGTQQGRPTPREWADALQGLEKCLKKCSNNPAHQFVHTLTNCPWCNIETASGVPLFPVAVIGPTQTGFTILSFWAKVSAVSNPGPAPPLPPAKAMPGTLSPEALELQQASLGARVKAGFLSLIGAPNHIQTLKQKIEAKAATARTRWENIQRNWESYCGDKDFQDRLIRLHALRILYEALPQRRIAELQKLEATRYIAQLHRYLDNCRIASARIKGLGSAKKATLQSYGIETAADITEQRVIAVPGFGPVLAGALAQWRYQQERRFVFDPNKGVEPAAKNAVERQILTARMDLEEKLNDELSKLTFSSNNIILRRQKILHEAEQLAREFVQAEASLRAASATPAVVPRNWVLMTIGSITIGGAIIAANTSKAPSVMTPAGNYPAQTQPAATTPVPPSQPALAQHVEREPNGQLRPEDGYDWVDAKRAKVRWLPGRSSRQNPHVIASHTEGEWEPEDGYAWLDPKKPKDKSVRWVPGTASSRHQNVVAGSIEGQWRPADGYSWVINPPRVGDMSVKPLPRVADQNLALLNQFERGLADRAELEQWVAGLRGDFRRGVDWWAARRSLPNAGTCGGTAASADFVSGCEAAKARLTPVDQRRKSDPEYRRGWNIYPSPSNPPGAPSQALTLPGKTDPPQSPENHDSAAELNEQELKRLQSR